MAKLSFASIENQPVATNENSGSNSGIKFFALKDGESAIVRILCNTVDDIEIYTVHNVVTDQWKYGRRMSCIRNPHDPIDLCPLCAANKPLMQRMYVKMIQYVTDPQTNSIIPTPVVWERSVNDKQFGARTLAGYLETFGALSNILFKFTRTGEKLNTTYQIIPNLPANVYPTNLYPNVPEIFGDYSPAGRAFMDRSAEDYRVFLATGNFPNPNMQATPKNEPIVSIPPVNENYKNNSVDNIGVTNTANSYAAPAYTAAPTPNSQTPHITTSQPQVAPNPMPASPAREPLPWEAPNNASGNNVGFERPIRRY